MGCGGVGYSGVGGVWVSKGRRGRGGVGWGWGWVWWGRVG